MALSVNCCIKYRIVIANPKSLSNRSGWSDELRASGGSDELGALEALRRVAVLSVVKWNVCPCSVLFTVFVLFFEGFGMGVLCFV